MPLYEFQCERCEKTGVEYAAMKDAVPVGDVIQCPHCGRVAYRRVMSLPHTDMKEFQTPIEMESIALTHPDDIAEFKRQCPDVDCSTDERDPLYGVPIARNRKQKLAALKAAGFVETN